MGVFFQSDRVADVAHLLSVEELYRLYGAWAGIHDFSFDAYYDIDDDPGTWVGTPAPTITGSDLELDATAEGAAWYPVLNDDCAIASSYAVQYSKTSLRQAVIVGDGSGTDFLVGTDDSGYPFVYAGSGASTYTVLKHSVPVPTPEIADVVVSFRQVQLTDIENEFWYVISMYMNDRLYMTYIQSASAAITDLTFGFGAYGGESITYSNIRVPELSDHAEYGTIDPGADAISGIQRAIEGRYIRNFVRHNGELRAFRPKAVPVAQTFTDTYDEYEVQSSVDISRIFSHVRMMGAYLWSEYHRPDLTITYGHKFIEENNPMLFTDLECYIEAERMLRRYEEDAITGRVALPSPVLIEPEDRIETSVGDWIVSGLNQTFDITDISADLDLRKYVWE